MRNRFIFLFITSIFLYNCGSGTFENDPESWNKIFGEDIPKEIEVLNSKFWKSTHWTFEFEFYCKLKADKKFIKEYFIDNYNLKKKEVFSSLNMVEIPSWFSIENFDDYEVWTGNNFNMKLYIHKNNNIIYLHCLQL